MGVILSVMFALMCCMFLLALLIYLPKIDYIKSYDGKTIAEKAAVTQVNKNENYTFLIVKCMDIGNVSLVIPNREGESVDIGCEIHFTSEVKFVDSLYYRGRECFLSGYAIDYEIFEPECGIQKLVYEIRSYVRSVTAKTNNSALANALLIGDRSGIDAETMEAFAKLGTSHVISLSGLHLTLLVMNLYNLFANKIKLKYSVLIFPLIAFLYSAIAGFPLSLIRSALMLSVFFASKLLRREQDSLTALFASALVVVFVNPFSLFDISFLLSFFATLGIVTLGASAVFRYYENFNKAAFNPFNTKPFVRILYFFTGKLVVAVCTTLSATLVTLPLIVLSFNKFSSVTILGNLLTVPLGEWYLLVSAVHTLFEIPGVELIAFPFRLAANACGKLFMGATYLFADLAPECMSIELIYTVLGIIAMASVILICVFNHRKSFVLLILTLFLAFFIPIFNSAARVSAYDYSVIEVFNDDSDALYVKKQGKSYYLDQTNSDSPVVGLPSDFDALNGKINVDTAVFLFTDTVYFERIKAFSDIYSAHRIIVMLPRELSPSVVLKINVAAGAEVEVLCGDYKELGEGVFAYIYADIATAFTVENGDKRYCDYHSYSDLLCANDLVNADILTFSGTECPLSVEVEEKQRIIMG